MDARAPAGAARAEVRLIDVTLHHALFADRHLPAQEVEEMPEHAGFTLRLRIMRASALRLSAVLSLEAREGLPFDLAVTYAAHFEMDAEVPEARRGALWREAALRRAPDVLFPHVRELVATLTARWGEAPLLLPADPYSLGLAFEESEIPPAPEGGDG